MILKDQTEVNYLNLDIEMVQEELFFRFYYKSEDEDKEINAIELISDIKNENNEEKSSLSKICSLKLRDYDKENLSDSDNSIN